MPIVDSRAAHARRFFTGIARSKRPFGATTTCLLRSRNTGFDAFMYDPHAHEPAAPLAFTHTTSPRSSSASSSWRMAVTSLASERYGLRPRFATFTAIRPPGSSTRTHSANTSRSIEYWR